MSDDPPAKPPALINVNLDLTKPLTVFIEKVSAGIGALAESWLTVRNAKAEAKAAIILAQTQVAGSDIKTRAIRRVELEAIAHQANMESIAAGAVPLIEDTARPEEVRPDWWSAFFSKCRDVSHEDMQQLWSKVLAGEANAPGSFSMRTLDFLTTVDERDASEFGALCRFVLFGEGGGATVLIYNRNHPVYTAAGLTDPILTHLDSIGLIKVQMVNRFKFDLSPGREVRWRYAGNSIRVGNDHVAPAPKVIPLGHAELTTVGRELSRISTVEPVTNFLNYVGDQIRAAGLTVEIR